jgi:CP family cyanate transporter-like MFS transporter
MQSQPGHAPPTDLLRLLGLLWLAGTAMRITILAVPPLIPLIHDDLRMTETQVGLLVGLPLFVFALAAVPGSLLIARLGVVVTLMLGMAVTGLAGAGRGAIGTVWELYAATALMGFGVAIMQPAVPALVREWLPQRPVLGTATFTNGMLAAVMLAPALTYPLVLPLVGNSWRLALVVWAAPVLATALLFALVAPRRPAMTVASAPVAPAPAAPPPEAARWWPDWRSPLTWLLGLTFGSNNAAYFGANAFLPDYLASQGRADLIGTALGSLNAAQFVASVSLLLVANRLHRSALPYLLFGPLTLAAFVGIVFTSGAWIVVWATLVGFATAVTFAVILALPPFLSRPGDVHRTAAGMFTISYSCAVAIPTLSGALWDLTGRPWTAFVPLGLCAITLTVLGWRLSRYRPEPP